MYSPTYGELKSNLQKELDIEDESFITADELLNYFNEAIDMVESTIHTIYEDYFLTSTTISLVNGTQEYDLPDDIYAQKIRGMFYSDGSTNIYEIKRVRQLKETSILSLNTNNTYGYKYVIKNSSVDGLKIVYYPLPSETSTNITLWYLRNAKRFSADADICDIPEFTAVVIQYARWKCLDKEGHPSTQMAGAVLQTLKQEMVDTLTARVPDEDNEVIADLSHISEFDSFYNGGFY